MLIPANVYNTFLSGHNFVLAVDIKRAHKDHHQTMKVKFEKNRQRLRRTIYWKPETIEHGMRLAELEGRSFNNWLAATVTDKWRELEFKRDKERLERMAA